MDSSPIVEPPVVQQDISNPNAITFIDSKLYKAAAKGRINPFNRLTEPLNLLLTPTKNTILHIHITQQPKGANFSISFTKRILTKCPSLLLQANNRGETPLYMAARYGHNNIVKLLIYSAKPSHQDIETGDGEVTTMLRMENVDMETALHEAVRHNTPTLVQILTEEDPDFTYLANRLGETPLYLDVERGYSDMALQILDTCSSPSFDGPNGRTALHEAVIRGNTEMTMKIIEAKRTLVKEVDQQGWTPLHHASCFGHLSIVNQLLRCDKSVAYIADKDGMIPLHLAAVGGNLKMKVVCCILHHCPDCHELVDQKGRNVLHFAVQSMGSILVGRLLRDFDKNYRPSLKNLINQKDVDGNTPVHLLATHCLSASTLIKHPFVDKMAVNNNNSTALDVISKNADNHAAGFKKVTLRYMKRVGGYNYSRRNFVKLKDRSPKVAKMEDTERMKNSHIIVAALVATVTFTAGFTLPGGYDGGKGTAILSGNGAFITFVITDTLALVLSTCALIFYIYMDSEATKRGKRTLLISASRFLMLSIFLMLVAFTVAVFAVLHHSTYLKVIIFLFTSFFVLIFWSQLKRFCGKIHTNRTKSIN